MSSMQGGKEEGMREKNQKAKRTEKKLFGVLFDFFISILV